MSGWDDEDWKPPTAEQLAEIEKRRARKIRSFVNLNRKRIPSK